MSSAELAEIRVQEHILSVKVSTFVGGTRIVENFPHWWRGGESTLANNGVEEGNY